MYERVGGEEFFTGLVDRFYEGVGGDPVLRPLYPDDLEAPKDHLKKFLVQYWGGPGSYSEERGHPRLRMRHAPFRIGIDERDAWLRNMLGALEAAGLPASTRDEMAAYFTSTATQLVNTVDRPPRGLVLKEAPGKG